MSNRRDSAAPDDLAEFATRMRQKGVGVTLPNAGPDYQLPEPFEIVGEPLSDTVIRLRRGSLPAPAEG